SVRACLCKRSAASIRERARARSQMLAAQGIGTGYLPTCMLTILPPRTSRRHFWACSEAHGPTLSPHTLTWPHRTIWPSFNSTLSAVAFQWQPLTWTYFWPAARAMAPVAWLFISTRTACDTQSPLFIDSLALPFLWQTLTCVAGLTI